MKKNNGGPAFPSEQYGAFDDSCKGMTIRDYFAAKALSGMIAQGGLGFMGWHPSNWDSSKGLAKSAYEIADAMLAARVKP